MSATMVPLGELCEIASGGTPRRSIIKYWKNGSIPWLKISDLAGKHISMAEETITYAGLENSSAKLFEPGTILVSIFATIGVAGILDIPATTNQAIAGIKPFDSTTLSPEYLYYWIIAQKEKMEASGRGVAQNNINLSYLRSLQIPLPDMERQRSIIAIFSMFDELFEYSKGRLQRFDDLVKSRFVEMFGDCTVHVSLGEVCLFKSGKTLPKEKEMPSGDYLYAKVGDLNLPGNERTIRFSRSYVDAATAKRCLIPKGAVVFPKRGGAIGTNKKRITGEDCCLDLNLMSVIPGEKIHTEYLLAWFEQMDLADIANGSTVPQINNKDLNPLTIALPKMELQQEFADFVSQVDKLRFEAQQQIEKLETLKKSLMQEYFG